MGKEFNGEKKFSKDVERLLAGKEVELGEGITDDQRTAIDFAKKLIECRVDPSPSFKASLKGRLLQELAKQEAEAARQKEKGNWFWEGLRRLVPQEPVWRNATATAVVVLLTVGVLWGTGVFTPSITTPQQDIVPTQEAGPRPEFGLGAAVDKIIDLNQAQTANGLSITLEQVVLSSDGITFSAFTTPPDYSLPQDFQGPMPPGMAPAVAEYTANGITRHAGDAEAIFTENGIRLTWGYSQPYLEPLTGDAGELVLKIISFGDWQGPWEFSVSLQD